MKYLDFCASLLRKKKFKAKLKVVICTMFVSGCQTTSTVSQSVNNSLNYSQYYVWLKTLNNKQLISEEQTQTSSNTSSNSKSVMVNKGKLVLIYSLPNSTLHQPYKAKRLLNNLLLPEHFLNNENLAFTTLLRDQLNTQLHLLQKQEKLTKSFNENTKTANETINQLTQQLNQKNIDLNRVNKQLKLLKKIDQRIEQRS